MTDEPTPKEIENLFVEETGFDPDDFPAAIFDFARAVLAKWGPSAPQAEQQAAPKATQVDPDKLMRDCLALLESFDYEDDEDSQSKAFFNAHINADWFFHVKHSIERQLEAKAAPSP